MTRPRRRRLALLSLVVLGGCTGSNNAPERVTLPPGTSFAALTDSLTAHGVVGSRQWFKLLARIRGVDRTVQAGIYEFGPRMSAGHVLDVLAHGKGATQRFTVPEGLTLDEVADLAQEKLGVASDSFVEAARDSALARELLGFPARSLEGFLRPETYTLPLAVDARGLVRLMVDGFTKGWKPEWTDRLDSLRMTRLQLVTFASIVEGEARVDEERETISGVYHNRLRIGMALQADPTIQYAIALKTGKRKPRLYERDYQFPSPYNTYLNPGLPPGPVNSPSLRSIEASLYPAKVPFLYFVAGTEGRHVFSRTYGEHLRAIAKVRGK